MMCVLWVYVYVWFVCSLFGVLFVVYVCVICGLLCWWCARSV